jgi:purine-binding chemotaxis protein CheW
MTGLYILFSVAGAEYAVAAAQVLQLESFNGAPAVPGALPHVAGIVQVRGRIVPVIDLRSLFGEAPVDATLDTRIIVVELNERTVALRVDSSREVLKLQAEQFQPTPTVVNERSRGFINAVANTGDRLLMILNLEKVIGEEELHDDSDHILEHGGVGRRALPG